MADEAFYNWEGMLGAGNENPAPQPFYNPENMYGAGNATGNESQPYTDFTNIDPTNYLNGEVAKTPMQIVTDNIAQHVQKNAGEIFTRTLAASAMGMLNYLSQHRKEKYTTEMLDKKRSQELEDVRRASDMPTVASVVKQGVTGKQNVGNQGAQGLIGGWKQRGA